jgi:hypothetical protein
MRLGGMQIDAADRTMPWRGIPIQGKKDARLYLFWEVASLMAKRSARRQTAPGAAHIAGGIQDSGVSAGMAEPSSNWIQFVRRYGGHPALEADTVYALSEPLIDAIQAEQKLKLLAHDEEEFERDLARYAGVGFFLRQPISFPTFPAPIIEESASEVQRWNDLQAGLHAMSIQLLKRQGLTDQEIEQHFAQRKQLEAKIEERLVGYTAWLATDPAFRHIVQQFRSNWQQQVRAEGRFRGFPRSLLGERPKSVPPEEREYFISYMTLYKRWGLQSLVSWELPLPMRPELSDPTLYDRPDLSGSGLAIFAPWYLFRDKDINIQELAAHGMTAEYPAHLHDWLIREPKNWGYDRYAIMLRIFVYLELALKRRYSSRVRRKQEALDGAFARVYYGKPLTSTESIRKIRQALTQRLNLRIDRDSDALRTNETPNAPAG